MPVPRDPPRVSIVRHPPERGREALLVLACGCSCCCCCLHSVGGLVGAVSGSAVPPQPILDAEARAGRRAGAIAYWSALGVIATGVMALGFLGDFGVPVAALGLGLPFAQICAAVLAVPVALVIGRRDRNAALAALARIGLLGIAGAIAGTVLMIGIFGVYSLLGGH